MSRPAPADRLRDDGTDPRRILVRCAGAGRTYSAGTKAVVAVHEASCTVRAGMRVALTGRSGSGKSTLLHLMSGLELPTQGVVEWPLWERSPAGRAGLVGVVFQGPSLLPALNVQENVALAPLLAGVGQPESRRRATDALELLGLDDLAGKLPQELSGGSHSGSPWPACSRPVPRSSWPTSRPDNWTKRRRPSWWPCCPPRRTNSAPPW